MTKTSTTSKPTPAASAADAAASPARDERSATPASRHPYRDAPGSRRVSGVAPLDRGDLALAWGLVAVGLVPVLAAVLRGGVWGREPSLGLLLVGFAARSLVAHYARVARRACGRGSPPRG